MIALLVVVAVVLLVMWLTRRRRNCELNGNKKGLALSNAVYGGKLTEYGHYTCTKPQTREFNQMHTQTPEMSDRI